MGQDDHVGQENRGLDLTDNIFAGLERSCEPVTSDGVSAAPDVPGMMRIKAQFSGSAYAPHRHDTYAIGITIAGVQSFRYRGIERHSLPGEVIILHPDEVHDGAAGTEAGLVYRMLYLDPELVLRSRTGAARGLPFVPTPVIRDRRLRGQLLRALGPIDEPLDDLLVAEITAEIADGLGRHADASMVSPQSTAVSAVLRAAEYLREHLDRPVASVELEGVTGLDRFSLARHFRRVLGTSPHRYWLMRRLEHVRMLLAAGAGSPEAAYVAGFADQSHMSRHFKNAFGLTPGRWAKLTSAHAASGRARRLST